MKNGLSKMRQGYQAFREKYAVGDQSIMRSLSKQGQNPQIMVVACCDSRVDPALILQCDPGDLFVVRNVANIVPPYEKDATHHGTSAALEFGICYLQVKHLILLGHSQCGGIQALLMDDKLTQNDFIRSWVSLIETPGYRNQSPDNYAKIALHQSHQHSLSFPWIQKKVQEKNLSIHLWFFDIKTGQIFQYDEQKKDYFPLNSQN